MRSKQILFTMIAQMNRPVSGAGLLLVFFFAINGGIAAQKAPALPPAVDFTTHSDDEGVHFKAQLPALRQIAGAPPAFYACYWEFGDGGFSFEESPTHVYPDDGEYDAVLYATNNYDDGKAPKGRHKKTPAKKIGKKSNTAIAGVFSDEDMAVGLRSNRAARAGEEMACILSYQNRSAEATAGRLYLFFNEKTFKNPHFNFIETRAHFGETPDQSGLSLAPAATDPAWNWVFSPSAYAPAGVSTPPFFKAPVQRVDQLLEAARDLYRDERVWRFPTLAPGEIRNLFASLEGAATMLKDTTAMIHLRAVFAPDNALVPAEMYEMEIEIVSSHDPNAIAVSDRRMNYRLAGIKNLSYKVRFQNNGEGPARTIALSVETPKGLKTEQMRPEQWYPKCPICPETPVEYSCLDTAFAADALIFTFRNIYLPGSRQKGVSDYDSTQGFVKYRIEPKKNMPKRAFSSRAKIVFDKNEPIYTNYTRTRFKPGISPGLKAGYEFSPDSLREGRFFMGASLSPFKSWRVYPQIEAIAGLQARAPLPEREVIETVPSSLSTADIMVDTVTRARYGGSSGYVSLEIPFLLRKNFSRFLGFGVGGSARLFFENGERTRTEVQKGLRRRILGSTQGDIKQLPIAPPSSETYSARYHRFAVFADLTLGAVRAGPNIGLRAGGILSNGFQPFAQLSVEVKL